MIVNYADGIFMFTRISVGWNFHRTRYVKTVVLGLALSFAPDRFLVTVGPVTFVWLTDLGVRRKEQAR